MKKNKYNLIIFQINITGNNIVRTYYKYADVMKKFGNSRATNIFKIVTNTAPYSVSAYGSLWVGIEKSDYEKYGIEYAKSEALFKVQVFALKTLFNKVLVEIKKISDVKDAIEIKKHLEEFIEKANIKIKGH